jgi:mannose/fructose/N-acetylgalactosamine-specific phosphotransferase system component IID
MTIAEILIVAFFILGLAIGRYSGYHDGYVKGRKAVRKYYESLQQVSR